MLKGPEYSLKKRVFTSPAFSTSSPKQCQISTRKAVLGEEGSHRRRQS